MHSIMQNRRAANARHRKPGHRCVRAATRESQRKAFKFTMATALVALMGTAAAAQERFVTIGTGGQTGVYYVVGQSICRLVNRGSAEHGLKCTAPSTGGSIANINAIAAGDMDMGVA